jgi:hypothetical protein
VFKGLINDFKSAAASFVARASVAVPFLVALGFATAAIGLELTERFGARNALWLLAGGFCAIGLLAAFAVTMKEQEMAADEEQRSNEGGIGEMTSAAATQAATQIPTAVLGALLQNPTSSALPAARLVGQNLPLVVLLLLLGLLFWPTEQTEEAADQGGDSAPAKPDGRETPPPSDEAPLREAA